MAKSNSGKCACNPGWSIAAAVLVAVGLLLAVQGFVVQLTLQGGWDMTTMSWILAYYFVGVVLIGGGKLLKWKAHGMCPVHGNMAK